MCQLIADWNYTEIRAYWVAYGALFHLFPFSRSQPVIVTEQEAAL